jgi:hypothetical protein
LPSETLTIPLALAVKARRRVDGKPAAESTLASDVENQCSMVEVLRRSCRATAALGTEPDIRHEEAEWRQCLPTKVTTMTLWEGM